MIQKLLFSAFLLISLSAYAQTTPDKYRSVSDSTGMIKAFYLTSDTIRINNPSLFPAGTAVPLFDDHEKQIAWYILNKDRMWIFTLNSKD